VNEERRAYAQLIQRHEVILNRVAVYIVAWYENGEISYSTAVMAIDNLIRIAPEDEAFRNRRKRRAH
jgi:hypothetical protein